MCVFEKRVSDGRRSQLIQFKCPLNLQNRITFPRNTKPSRVLSSEMDSFWSAANSKIILFIFTNLNSMFIRYKLPFPFLQMLYCFFWLLHWNGYILGLHVIPNQNYDLYTLNIHSKLFPRRILILKSFSHSDTHSVRCVGKYVWHYKKIYYTFWWKFA